MRRDQPLSEPSLPTSSFCRKDSLSRLTSLPTKTSSFIHHLYNSTSTPLSSIPTKKRCKTKTTTTTTTTTTTPTSTTTINTMAPPLAIDISTACTIPVQSSSSCASWTSSSTSASASSAPIRIATPMAIFTSGLKAFSHTSTLTTASCRKLSNSLSSDSSTLTGATVATTYRERLHPSLDVSTTACSTHFTTSETTTTATATATVTTTSSTTRGNLHHQVQLHKLKQQQQLQQLQKKKTPLYDDEGEARLLGKPTV